jgi:hypothetical protein
MYAGMKVAGPLMYWFSAIGFGMQRITNEVTKEIR